LPARRPAGQELACPGIDPHRAHAAEDAFSRQGEDDGNRPVNAFTDCQLWGVAAELRAELVHDVLCDPPPCRKGRDIQWLCDMDVNIQSTFGWKQHGWQMGDHGLFPRVGFSNRWIIGLGQDKETI